MNIILLSYLVRLLQIESFTLVITLLSIKPRTFKWTLAGGQIVWAHTSLNLCKTDNLLAIRLQQNNISHAMKDTHTIPVSHRSILCSIINPPAPPLQALTFNSFCLSTFLSYSKTRADGTAYTELQASWFETLFTTKIGIERRDVSITFIFLTIRNLAKNRAVYNTVGEFPIKLILLGRGGRRFLLKIADVFFTSQVNCTGLP